MLLPDPRVTANAFRRLARRLIRGSPPLQRAHAVYVDLRRRYTRTSYADKAREEIAIFQDDEDIHRLPAIFDYWSNTYLVQLLEPFGVANPDEFFAKHLRESAAACDDAAPRFVSLGAGNCDTEVRVARLLRAAGLAHFTLDCVDLNAATLERGRELAEREGVGACLRFVQADLNTWRADRPYAAAMANHSLHHVVALERLFDNVRSALQPRGAFAISDIVGRNGHRRWPEALALVREFWRELPPSYRYNVQLARQENVFANWDCSHEGFEGVRAQDILPLLLERFACHVFIGFANVVDVFTDRSFGPHFDPARAWDREFIDRVHAADEAGFARGTLTPTHVMAVFGREAAATPHWARGLSPERSVRNSGHAHRLARLVAAGLARLRRPRG